MPPATKYMLIAAMDVEPDKEDLFNEVYDTEHIPAILGVPGVASITRLTAAPFAIGVGGEVQKIELGDEPVYAAIYEIDDPGVLVSPEWSKAVETGRWGTEVRPFTKNRRFALRRVVE